MTEWFEQWFGEEYLKLYPHRDEEDAQQVVELLATVAALDGRCALDLACGSGRHLEKLRLAGTRAVGFDLSMPLLSRARHRGTPPLTVVRGDMRYLPFRAGSFDIVVNLFTSFGYFSDDAQHVAVLREVAIVLKPGGIFVLDYFNADRVLDGLVPREERAIGNQHVVIERRVTDDRRFVIKEMHLMDDGRQFVERVRLFTPADLEALIGAAGLHVRHRFGDYEGGSVERGGPRVLLFSDRP